MIRFERTTTLRGFDKVCRGVAVVAAVQMLAVAALYSAEGVTATKANPSDVTVSAAAAGKLVYRMTEPQEFKQLIGPGATEATSRSGGMELLVIEYPEVEAIFTRMRGQAVPFGLFRVVVRGRGVDIGQDRKLVLRDEEDLKKFDTWGGFWNAPAGVSLAKLDLKRHGELLETMPFDSRTEWPGAEKLPEGFDPVGLLEQGKGPGLGIRRLHSEGIDGRGVGIAILDQPLLKDHVEYGERVVRYEEIEVEGMAPKMHGAPIASIAVGRTCGVAPGAALSYYAMRATSMPDNKVYCDIIDQIIRLNRDGTSEPIRVVSISTGTFAQQANFDLWKETVNKAEREGILVVTCAQDWLAYGMLARVAGENPDDPNSYKSGAYDVRSGALLVPAGNRATASHYGPQVYTYWTDGGMSWAAPYLAGLAALAYQVEPAIKPGEIVKLWRETAAQTDAGAVVNPPAFIEAVRRVHKTTQRSEQ